MNKNLKLGLMIFTPIFVIALGLYIYLANYETEVVEVNIDLEITATEYVLLQNFDTLATVKVYKVEFPAMTELFEDYSVYLDQEEVARGRLDQMINDVSLGGNVAVFGQVNKKFKPSSTFDLTTYQGEMYVTDLGFFKLFEFVKVEEDRLIGSIIKKRTITTYQPKVSTTISPLENQIYVPGEVFNDSNGNSYLIEGMEPIGEAYTSVSNEGVIQRLQDYVMILTVNPAIEDLEVRLAHLREGQDFICLNTDNTLQYQEYEQLEGKILEGQTTGTLHISCPSDFDQNNYARLELMLHTYQPDFTDVWLPYYYDFDQLYEGK